MIERLLLAVILVGVGFAAAKLYARSRLARRSLAGVGLEAFRRGRPAILFFSGESCASCHTIQRPALEHLAGEFSGRLQVIEIDALARPHLADHWGVLSLPTTFVIDRSGRPRRVNHGPARAERLRAQLAEIGERPPAPAGAAAGVESESET
jgi:thioredoxin-like negative regulator of GroEL